MAIANCIFCTPPQGLAQKSLEKYPSLRYEQAIYCETPNFISMIEDHPVIPESPYFLVIPREHYTAFSQIKGEMRSEIAIHLQTLNDVVRAAYPRSKKNLIMFEHGQAKDGNKVKSIYHAHLHVIYTDFAASHIIEHAEAEMTKYGVPYHEDSIAYCNPLHNIDAIGDGEDYLYLRINETCFLAVSDGEELYSQFFRVVLAEACGLQFINWKTATPAEQNIFYHRVMGMMP